MTDSLSPALVAFLRDNARSLELIEVLLFLQRYPEAAFDAAAIAGELRLQPRSVAARCAQLHKLGIVDDEQGRARYVASGELATLVAELALAWSSHRSRVIEIVFSRPADNVRIFADAFVIGGKKPDGG